MSDVERLARVYSEITGITVVPRLLENLARLPDLAALAACDEALLRRAGQSLQRGPGHGFVVAEWGRAVQRVNLLAGAAADSARVVLASGLPLGAPRPLRLMLEEVGGYVDESMQRLSGRFSSELLAEGRSRILSRALTAEFREGALARRRSRWRRDLSLPAGRPPVIEADEVEEVLVHLLALTWPEAQFSYRPSWSGEVFAGWNNGWHRRDSERVYVTGLSDILDSVREVVEGHRDGQGGRVYLRDGRVACADCRLVIAWVGEAKTDQVVPAAHLKVRRAGA